MSISTRGKWLRGAWMVVALVGIFTVLYLLVHPSVRNVSAKGPLPGIPQRPDVDVDALGLISIAAESMLWKHLESRPVERRELHHPALNVGGVVLARIVPGTAPLADRWQFHTAELATTYADWIRETSEVEFARKQLEKTRQLIDAEVTYLGNELRRIEALADRGGLPERNLREARADLLKTQLQGEKDDFAAQTLLRSHLNNQTALERRLSAGGIEPVVFGRAVEHMVLVAAHVPESHIAEVREDQGCTVRFFAFEAEHFEGHVETLGSQLTDERRTLKVLFELSDSGNRLKPGMYGEVGLGTDSRQALLIPAEGLVHVGTGEYALVKSSEGKWLPTPVVVGPRVQEGFEVQSGLREGDVVLTRGAILLKPALTEALTPRSPPPTTAAH